MADITIDITIPDQYTLRVGNAFDGVFQGRVEAGLNLKQWYKLQLINFTKRIVKQYEIQDAKNTAIATANTIQEPELL